MRGIKISDNSVITAEADTMPPKRRRAITGGQFFHLIPVALPVLLKNIGRSIPRSNNNGVTTDRGIEAEQVITTGVAGTQRCLSSVNGSVWARSVASKHGQLTPG